MITIIPPTMIPASLIGKIENFLLPLKNNKSPLIELGLAIASITYGGMTAIFIQALFFAGRYADATRVAAALETLDPGRTRLLAAAAAVRAGATKQARTWMAEEFAHWKPLLEQGDPRAYRTVRDWQTGWLLHPVWTQNLDQLPAEERGAWSEFWIVPTRALEESER